MKWIVGLDLRPNSQGPLAFARWLVSRTQGEGADTFHGIHVLEEQHLQAILRHHHLDEVMRDATAACEAIIASAGAEGLVASPALVKAVHVEKALASALDAESADAVLISRQASREGRKIVRLGKVARRMIRLLPSPVAIVPPDLSLEDVGEGPIVVLTKLTDDSLPAAQFALSLGKRVGCPVHLAHVLPIPEEYGSHYLPETVLAKLRAEHEVQGKEAMAAWVARHKLTADATVILQGPVVEEAQEYAAKQDAAMLVSGSRRLNTIERLLLASVGMELAAHARRPVVLVPPEGEG